VKCDNWLFWHHQDQCSYTSLKSYSTFSHLVASTNISSTHSKIEDIKMNAVWLSHLYHNKKNKNLSQQLHW